jgi:Fic family protein
VSSHRPHFLQGWQAALFPTGFSGMTPIQVGDYRAHAEPMQIVSGGLGRERVHYQAPPSDRVPEAMEQLLAWFNLGVEPDSLVCAALAHVWFETIHPFEDGNGRVGRVLVDLDYYAQLERAQRGGVDVTAWVVWFITQFQAACEDASRVVDDTLAKTRFWAEHNGKALNARQRRVMNLLLDAGPGGFEGGMSTKKYESLAKTSRATASRELTALEELGLLQRVGGGRSTRYYPALQRWAPPGLN